MARLSFAQRRLWFIDRFEGPSATYNIPLKLTLAGRVDTAALDAAVRDVVVRHEPLRTVFDEGADGVPSQRVVPESDLDLTLEVRDVATDAVDAAVDGVGAHVFDIAAGIPVRAVLLRTAPDASVLVILVHHIAADGESMVPLVRDLSTAYRARCDGAAPVFEPLPVRYRDYAAWQREVLGEEDDPESEIATQLAYWRAELDGQPPRIDLPTDRPRPPEPSHRGDVVAFRVEPRVLAAARELAAAEGVTMPMLVQSVLAVLLQHLGAGPDVSMGAPNAGRDDEALADLVGFFVNTWVLRVDLSGSPTFREVLDRVGGKALDAYDNADAPFERLVEVLNPERSRSHHPLFQVMVAWQDNFHVDVDMGGVTGSGTTVSSRTSKFDLELAIGADAVGDGLSGFLEYAEDLFDRASAEAIAERFVRLLRRVVDEPGRPVDSLDVLAPAERAYLLTCVNDTAVALAQRTVPELVGARVAQTPDATAVVCGDVSLSYAELDARANRLARALVARGAGPESLVGLALPRTADLVVGMLGILKSGAGYVPIDPRYPSRRLDLVLSESCPAVVLSDASTVDVLPDDGTPRLLLDELDLTADTAGAPLPVPRGDNVAYVMYTSGSSGTPKGVAITHAGVVSDVLALAERVGVTAGSRMLAATSVNFDVSVYEVFAALGSGATVEVVRDVLELAERPSWSGDVVSAVPSVFVEMLDDVRASVDVGTLVFAGEVLSASAVRRVREAFPRARVLNGYGQTETFYASAHEVPADRPDTGNAAIGTPLWNTRTYVLGAGLTPVPAGVVGELYVGGSIGRGYHGRADMTAERFVADPFGEPGGRMYRTGDLARWRSDGVLECVGRADSQVKLHGLRIEPAEVQAALVEHPSVGAAVVAVRESAAGTKQLVGWLVPADGSGVDTVDTSAVRRSAAERLPEYSVPSVLTVLDRLPLDLNGKVDRSALPAPEIATGTSRAPRTPAEEELAAVFAEVLGVERVGVDDDFFAVGGDSIRSIQVVARARARGLELTPRAVFDLRTVAELAAVATAADGDGPAVLEELPGGGVGWMPLTPAGTWLADLVPDGRYGRFAMSLVLDLPAGIDAAGLTATLAAVLDHHDVLRARLATGDDGAAGMVVGPAGSVAAGDVVHRVPCSGAWSTPGWRADLESELDAAADRLDPAAGAMVRAVWFDAGPDVAGRLALVLHHLVVDGVSWRVLLPDLAAAWTAVRDGRPVALPAVGTSVRRWAHALAEDAGRPDRSGELDLWRGVLDGPDPVLGRRRVDRGRDTMSTVATVRCDVPADVTERLLTAVPATFRSGVNDGLLAGLAVAVARWRRARGVDETSTLVRLEGHGREETLVPGADLSRTVGWFTSMFPVRVDTGGHDPDDACAGGAAAGAVLKAVKEQLAAIPDKGAGYGPLRWTDPATAPELAGYAEPQIGFNYLGRFSATDMPHELRDAGFTQVLGLDAEPAFDPDMPALSSLEINSQVTDTADGPRLEAELTFPTGVLDVGEVTELAGLWREALTGLARYAATPGAGGLTPSDLPLLRGADAPDQAEIEAWERDHPGLADAWPPTPLQSGLLFHSTLVADRSDVDVYQVQLVLELSGAVDERRMRAAGQAMLDRHPNLRAAFVARDRGGWAQLVVDRVELPWRALDLRACPEAERAPRIERFLADDHARHFDPAAPPLLRLALLRTGDDTAELVFTAHHVLFDGWSIPLIVQELLQLYGAGGDPAAVPVPRAYRDFLGWLDRRDHDGAAAAWRDALAGVEEPTLVAPGDAGPDDPHGLWTVDVDLPEAASARLARRAAGWGVTVNTVVQAAWAILLGQLTGRDDVVFGATVSGRPADLPGVDSTIGMFINTVPVRVPLHPETPVGDAVAGLQRAQAGLLEHHHRGLTDIRGDLGLPELFDTLVVFESYPVDDDALARAGADAGLEVTGMRPFSPTHYPLTLAAELDPHLHLSLQYQRGRLDHDAVERISARLARLLGTLAATGDTTLLGGLDLLAPDERDRVLVAFNDTAAPSVPMTVPERFERQVRARPDAEALVAGATTLTYAGLNARANRLAHELIARGVGPEASVALVLPRTADLVVAILAVGKAGGAYVPIDPSYPAERIAGLLADSDPVLVISDADLDTGISRLAPNAPDVVSALADRPDHDPTDADRTAPLTPDNRVYTIYTSGSTGRPKGVVVAHASVSNLVDWGVAELGAATFERALATTAITFDVSVFDTLVPLLAGGSIVLLENVLELADRDVGPAGLLCVVPSALDAVGDRARLDRIGTIALAGEALPTSLVRRLREVAPDSTLANIYGPTESCVYALSCVESDADGGIPVGRPVSNVRALVLDGALRPAPVGATGELYLAGAGLARAYHRRAGLTAERFVADPFGVPGTRMYRTGDLARWDGAGRIEYLGRADQQVKVRGFRIEPGEIESVLAGHPDVARAVVLARDGGAAGPRLVAWVLPAGGAPVEPEALRAYAGRSLPEYMVPAAVVPVDGFALTPNGKLDRSALPEPDLAAGTYRAPTTASEQRLAELFADVLGVPRVGLDDGFFALGGHSLLVTRLVGRIREAFGVELLIRTVFEAPTVAELAGHLRDAGRARPALERRTADGGPVPLSYAQRRLWFIDRFEGASATYDIPLRFRLAGPVDAFALCAALRDVVVRHESLRTVFVTDADGVPAQRVVPETELGRVLTVRDVAAGDAQDAVAAESDHVFDLAADIPVHAVLLRHDDGDADLVLVVHHIAADGESMVPLVRDLSTAYAARCAGTGPEFAPLPVQYADYAVWQRELLGDEDDPDGLMAAQSEYWRAELAGAPQPVALPTDRPRPPEPSRRGDVVAFDVEPDLVAAVRELAEAEGVTLPMVVQSAVVTLLQQLGAGPDVSMGSPIAGRSDGALADLVGFFVNTWVLRVDLSGAPSFRDVVRRVRAKALGAYDNADAPFERLVEVLNPERSRSYHPLFQVMFAWQDSSRVELTTPSSTSLLEMVPTGTAKFDLQFAFGPDGDGLSAHLEYAADLFDRSSAETVAERFVRLLRRVLTAPDDRVGALDVLAPDERDQLLERVNDTAVTVPGVTVPQLVEARVAQTPDATAVVCGDVTLSYAELDARANRLARALVARGAGPESLVGLALPRTADLVVGMLGILKSGAGYVPIDPRYPSRRLDLVLSESRPAVVLSDASTVDVLPDDGTPRLLLDELGTGPDTAGDLTDADRSAPLRPGNAAYVMYTSGSSGTPKGVTITHEGIVNDVASLSATMGVRAGSRVLAATSVNFDVSVFEVFSALGAGGTVEVVRDVLELAERGGWSGGVIHAVPTVFAEILDQVDGRLDVGTLAFGGDALSADLLARIRAAAPGARIVQAYGQTEDLYATTHVVPEDWSGPGNPPIGTPLWNVRTYVLGDGLAPVAPGVPGELYVGGSIGRGYHGRPDLTAERFVADPFGAPGDRMYRTGDLARWTADGALEYLGRGDTQTKIRGFRVETAEIEAVLREHPSVSAAVVAVRDGRGAGGKQLVGYVVPTGSGVGPGVVDVDVTALVDVTSVRRFAAQRLPEYSVPSVLMVLDALPLDLNGKVARAALPEPDLAGGEYRAPRTGAERELAAVFAEVLGVERVGVDDDFFAVGGDSIRSIQVVARARARGLEVTPRQVFDRRTVAELAQVAVASGADGPAVLAELDGGGVGRMPLTPVGSWLMDLVPSGGMGRFAMTSTVELPVGIDAGGLAATLAAVLDHHDVLRSRLVPAGDGWELEVAPAGTVSAEALLRRVRDDRTAPADRSGEVDAAMDRLDPAAGVMVQAVWFDAGPDVAGRLALVLHHFVVDGVSWRVLLPDLAAAWSAVREGRAPSLPAVGTSVRRWSHALAEEAAAPGREDEFPFWRDVHDGPDPLLGRRRVDPARDTMATVDTVTLDVPPDVTEGLLTALPAAYRGGVNDGLLAGLAVAVARWRRRRGVDETSTLVRLEGHGREEALVPGADVSRTVGWFTSMFPVRVDTGGHDPDAVCAGGDAAGAVCKTVKEQLAAVPDKGAGYGLLRWSNASTAPVLAAYAPPQIGFNYLGRFSAADMPDDLRGLGFTEASDAGDDPGLDPGMPALSSLEINSLVADGPGGPRLEALLSFPTGVLDRADVTELAGLWRDALTGLARHAATPGAGGLTPSDLPLVDADQDRIDAWERTCPGLADVWPLTPLQSGLLFQSELGSGSVDAYQMQFVFHLDGEVDPDRMRVAGQALLARHANLRAAFVAGPDGGRVQLVPSRAELPWQALDLRGLGDADRAAELEAFLAQDHGRHFDPATAPLLRLALVRTGDTSSELVLTAHHVLFDGWSSPVLVQELLRLYGSRGAASALPPVRGYREFLAWRQRQDHGAAAGAWRDALAGVDEPTLLAPAAGTGAAVVDEQVAHVEVALTGDETRALSRRAGEWGVTVNTMVQAAWAILLGRLTGRDDVVFGATVSGRPPELSGVDSMVGLFVNTVPVRMALDPATPLADAVTGLQRAQAGLLDHHHRGLTEIQQDLGTGALFDTLVVFESYPFDGAGFADADAQAGLTVGGMRVASGTHYPLTVMAVTTPQLQLSLDHRPDVLDRATVETTAARLVRILRGFAEDPDRRVGTVDLLDLGEHRALAARNDTIAPLAAGTVPELFAAQVARTPDAVAVECGEVSLTYAELAHRAGRLAAELAARGAGPETLVALALPRTADLVVGLLGILGSGAAYLPVDPAYPGERLAVVLGEARPALVLTDAATAPSLPLDGQAVLHLETLDPVSGGPVLAACPARPDNPAYVMYTSGSSGRPKGVSITHHGVVNGVTGLIAATGRPAGARTLAATSVNFDVSVFEMLTTLGTGGVVEVVRDVLVLAERDGWEGGVLSTVPSAFAGLADRAGAAFRADTLVFAGEALPSDLVRRARAALPGVRIVNGYGQSETFYASAFVLEAGDDRALGDSAPIGTPLGNMRTYVLGPGLVPVPPGEVGELYVAGAVGRGYHQNPGLTAERFTADPYGPPGARMYRTGDLARWDEHGCLEYRGRADQQVKVRGFRIEPGEVESALVAHPSVERAVVTARDGGVGGKRLVAHVVPAAGAEVDPAAVAAFVGGRLPEYMMPSAVVPMAALPTTPNGKLDRAALPEPEFGSATSREPATGAESRLARLFAEALGLDRVGADDGFFALGGHSLLATRLVGSIAEEFGVTLPIRAVFEHPTVAELAVRLESGDGRFEDPYAPVLTIRAGGEREPLWFVQPGFGLSWSYLTFAPHIRDRPMYAFQAPGFSGAPAPSSLAEMVDGYVGHILDVQPRGPYLLAGWSFGGTAAHAVAAELERRGHEVGLLALLDCAPCGWFHDAEEMPRDDVEEVLADWIGHLVGSEGYRHVLSNSAAALLDHMAMLKGADSPVFSGSAVFLNAVRSTDGVHAGEASEWKPYVEGGVEEHDIDTSHPQLCDAGPAAEIAAILDRRLDAFR